MDISAHDRALFNRISEQYCRKDLLPAHSMARRARLVQSLKVLPPALAGDILEVGCGAGFSAQYLKGDYRSFRGVDHAEELVAFARHNQSGDDEASNDEASDDEYHPDIDFTAMDAWDLKPDRQYDIILMIGVLHHVENDRDFLRHLAVLLKPGGWIVANEPQKTNPVIQLARMVRGVIDRGYSTEQKYYDRAELLGLYGNAGLARVSVRPQGLFSTPFAEVIMPCQPVMMWLSRAACKIDAVLERWVPGLLGIVSWNYVAVGQRRSDQQPGA